MMRRQQDLPLYAGYGAPPGNGSRTRRPQTQEVGRLPSIFDKSTTQVVMPVGSQRRQEAGLGLDIKAMPALGLPVVQAEPRLPKNMLSSSDTTADRLRQARKGYVPSQGSRRSSIVGAEPSRKERRRNSQPAVIAPLSANRRKGNLEQVGLLSGYYRNIEGPARSNIACEPLPPIGTAGYGEMEEGGCGQEEETVGGSEKDGTRTESSVTDSSDEEVGSIWMAKNVVD